MKKKSTCYNTRLVMVRVSTTDMLVYFDTLPETYDMRLHSMFTEVHFQRKMKA
jgi:hypothetical protein